MSIECSKERQEERERERERVPQSRALKGHKGQYDWPKKAYIENSTM